MSKTRTMYMHTLDERPASIQRDPKFGVWLAYAGGRHKARLYDSLSEIRREWVECLDTVERDKGHDAAMAAVPSYGYVLVAVPA